MAGSTILVVKYKNPEVENRLLNSMSKTAGEYDLVMLDNSKENRSLASLWNEWLNKLYGKKVCLVNSDCVIEQPDWLSRLEMGFQMFPDAVAVGPSTNCTSGKQNVGAFENRGQGYAEIKRGYLSGFCLLVDTIGCLASGGFDETGPFYGQESDMLRSAMAIGYRQVWCEDAWVWHEGKATAKKFLDLDREIKAGIQWFREKNNAR